MTFRIDVQTILPLLVEDDVLIGQQVVVVFGVLSIDHRHIFLVGPNIVNLGDTDSGIVVQRAVGVGCDRGTHADHCVVVVEVHVLIDRFVL